VESVGERRAMDVGEQFQLKQLNNAAWVDLL
jgi:hypothetical protein